MASSRSIGAIFAELSLRDTKFQKGLKGASRGLKNFNQNALNMFTGLGGKLAAAAGIGSLGGLLAKSIGNASDLSETVSKSEQIFGRNAKAMELWANGAADAMGQSKAEALGAAATMGNLFIAMKLGEDEAASMSKQMVELAADLASFNNTSSEDAINAIGAALRGESEPIRRYGVLLDDATLKAKAFAMGIYDGKGTLAPATRALAAYQVIIGQTTAAQGDFARTSDGLANSQRILKANFENATAEIGEGLLPGLVKFSAALKDIDMQGFGEDIGESLASAMEILTSGKAWELFKLQGIAAIEGIIMSAPFNDLAILANATWDKVTGQSTFKDAVNKYADAGDQARIDRQDEIAAKMDEIQSGIESKRAARIAASEAQKAYDAARRAEHESAPDWIDPNGKSAIPPIIIPEDVQKIKAEIMPSLMDTIQPDAYQARGLSLSKTPADQTADKTLTVMEQVRDILKRASTDGTLVWS